MRGVRLVIATAVLAGCGNDEVVPHDAPSAVDAAVDAPPDATLDATVDAPPQQRCIVSVTVVQLLEGLGSGPATATVDVSLALPPAASVDVPIVSADPSAATVTPATLTFTPASYGTPQTIVITAVDDVDVLSENTTVSCTVPGATATTIQVYVSDQTDAFLSTSITLLAIDEGVTGMFSVSISAMPPNSTTVYVTSADVDAVTAAPDTVVIMSADWNIPHGVTVTGVQDADAMDESVTLLLEAVGMPSRTITVLVNDDD